MELYEVRNLREQPEIFVEVPGSKSMTNRALLMAAMATTKTTLSGVLFSDDSRHFIRALQDLGFAIEVDEPGRTVCVHGEGGKIPVPEGRICVGSAGTAARFLTAFAAMNPGIYRIESSEQMKRRPMRELFEALEQLGAEISYLEEPFQFPVEITGITDRTEYARVTLDIDRSSQFLSALLMTAPLRFDTLDIALTGTRSARSYVEMTQQMMQQFGHPGVTQVEPDVYRVSAGAYQADHYVVEPDVSAACYFYAAAAITGGTACVAHMKPDSLQGDCRFLDLLEQMGCRRWWKDGQLYLQGPQGGRLRGITADLSDYSDQTLTLAAIAPFADGQVTVQGVGHIRGQECDRLHAIAENMHRMGIRCEEHEDGVTIYPGVPAPARIATFGDHRVAMAFAVTGLRSGGLIIEDPGCCAKTFEGYFQVLDKIIEEDEERTR